MLTIFRLLCSIIIIILILPQTRTENIVLKWLHRKRYVGNYGTTKKYLNNLSWFCIIFFLMFSLFTSLL